ncbi:hypothetical protein SK3146_01504 [Paenibacillus konkukensis]|uniref:Peptidylprolyl isomerase n=1 Tax=Paenibacillus konkukensis TaxID=2020716 RepID=A0ABY4RIV5_9BACL|nr:hypothetical protein [Paenibacillus konkukensis]UQZ82347.1 hypothetical protein SK3146_01504 [Paenibacillus konkukensis]
MYIIISPKRILIVGTMVLTITVGIGTWDKAAAANGRSIPLATADHQDASAAREDRFLQALGAATNEEVYDALLEGQSLADIAGSRQTDVNRIIHLQVAELTAQLDARLAGGSLRQDQYEALKAELTETVKQSVYGRTSSQIE